jgi:hypothetical protein
MPDAANYDPAIYRPSIASLRGAAFASALAAATLLCGLVSVSLASAPAPTHTCGHFFRQSQDFIVSKGGAVSCTKAEKIVKDFVFSKGVTQHGTSDADSYWTIASFPGWKCIQSMAVGSCSTAHASAGYTVKASG